MWTYKIENLETVDQNFKIGGTKYILRSHYWKHLVDIRKMQIQDYHSFQYIYENMVKLRKPLP